jgi:1,2-diacylglycerol 3-alpha-glucosyltransferase
LPLVDTGYYFSLRYRSQAQRLLRSMDIVHCHHPFLSGRLAIRYCRPRGQPIVFTNHTRYDLYAQAYLPILPESISETFLKAYLPSFCAACDLVIAPSAGLKEVLARFGVVENVAVVPNGIDFSLFRQPVVALDRSEMGFLPNDVLLMYTGRLGPEKNLPFLLRAFAGIAKTFDNVGLIVVGDGPERENLLDRVHYMGISSRVYFTGRVPYEQLPRYLALADAFVTASVTEVHPLSVLEAMGTGLPVLGIRSPGIGDIVTDGVNGILAEEEDLAVFTAKMVRLVTDRDLRTQLGEQARQVTEEYAVEHTTSLLMQHYQRLVEAANGRQRGFRLRLRKLLDNWF